jgi:hypothetical protein
MSQRKRREEIIIANLKEIPYENKHHIISLLIWIGI